MSHEEQWQGSRVSHKCFFYNSSLWIFIGSPRYLVTTVVTNLFFFFANLVTNFVITKSESLNLATNMLANLMTLVNHKI